MVTLARFAVWMPPAFSVSIFCPGSLGLALELEGLTSALAAIVLVVVDPARAQAAVFVAPLTWAD